MSFEHPQLADAQWLWDNEPCRSACPVHTDAGAYVTAIAEGRYRDAYRIARAPNPFPSICGRVCAAPCETACRRGKLDAPVAIRALKRFVTEKFGVESFDGAAEWHAAHGPIPPATLGSVAVVGGGPGGLAAAHDLRLAGHPVTIYESEDRLGGMMVFGIPEYRLARQLIDREIGAIIEMGVDVQRNCRIGRDVEFAELLDQHAAVFIAVGTSRGRDLQIPGHDNDGVLKAIEFLLNVNRGYHVDLGERVVVVGGGNVAFDVARTALRAGGEPAAMAQDAADEERRSLTTTLDAARAARRAGVRHVTVIALESPAEMPASHEEIEEAESEGITIVYRRGPHRILGEGHTTGLETIGVASVFDAEGRFSPTFIEGSEEVIPADTVILAVGQSPDIAFLPESVGRARFGGVAVDGQLHSSDPRVWAGGDVAFGPRNLIDAISDGRRAARSIHATLTGTTDDGSTAVKIELVAHPGYRRLSTGYDSLTRVPVPMVPIDRRIGFTEVETGFGEAEASVEALRCLRCFDNIMLRPELCILCGLCVDVCPHRCISIVRGDHGGLGTQSQSALLIDEELCIRCGLCVNRCPPSALVMVNAKEVFP